MPLLRRNSPPAPAASGLLEAYKARQAPDLRGYWVYAFADPLPAGEGVGKVWYVGQTGNIWSRWRDHYYRWPDRFPAAAKYLIPVRDEGQADVVELALIDAYQPECNEAGKAADLARKVRNYGRGNHFTRGFGEAVS